MNDESCDVSGTHDATPFRMLTQQIKKTVGITNLTPVQTAENERIFGQRYLSIQQRPEIPSRTQRRKIQRALRKAQR